MTIPEASERLRQAANQTMSGDELRGMVRDLYGKANEREVTRLLQEVRFVRVGRSAGGAPELDPAFTVRLRRDFNGPLRLDGVDLLEGPDVTGVEEDGARWYIAPQGAVMRLNHWLAEQMTPKPEPEPEPEAAERA